MKVSYLALRHKCPTRGTRPLPTMPCRRPLLWLPVYRSGQAAVASCYLAMCFENSLFMKSYISIKASE